LGEHQPRPAANKIANNYGHIQMTFTEAAAEVLRLAGKPLHYKEITELAIEKNLLSHVGKSPEVTMGARLAALLKKEDKTNPIVRVKPGVFALREWDDKKGRRSKAATAEVEAEEVAAPESDDADEGINALEVEAATRGPEPVDDEGEGDDDLDGAPAVVSGEDALRADLAASGAELFDDEEDDDQPIFGRPAPAGQNATAGQAGPPSEGAPGEGGRRRRRRRRRGRGGDRDRQQPVVEYSAQPIQPMPIVSVDDGNSNSQLDVTRESPAPRPIVRERSQIMGGGMPTGIEIPLGEGEELAGKELADAAALVLGAFDRNSGPAPLRAVVDALVRRGRLAGDPAAAQTQLSASVRADNLRRAANSQRPRFRFASGQRVALTDWTLGPDLARLELDVMAAIERYREAARRTMLRRLQELPGHAFIELALFGLERAGMVNVRAVRRAGSPGGEAHFAAIHKTGSDEIRTAIIVRKDGREIGRERVSDLRGALHHYGPASAGWLVTTGQVLSGAREEAAAQNAPPIALYDGLGFCRLLEDHDVAVVKTRFPIAIPDLELLESLRGA
jgi:HB1, ASXL, restriction endonuclease HTH domain/Restriction endonuclease